MASKKHTILGPAGRQAAYTSRNRAALIVAAQQVLAEIGPNATIEQLVDHAKVSPNTIYNHFDSKETLLSEALSQIWQDWVIWAYEEATFGESFQSMITVCRKLFLAGETHPLFASVLKNTLDNPDFVIKAVQGNAVQNLKKVMTQEDISSDSFEQRVLLWSYSLAGILHGVHVSGTLSTKQADEALEISLAIWNLSPAKARKLVSAPLTKQ
jgi:AcrR family transcriptional regulator